MPRDYSSRTGANRNRKRRRSRPAAKPKSAGVPGWIWLFCGLCLGLVVAAGVFVFGRPAGSPGLSIDIAGVPGDKTPAAKQPESEPDGKKKNEKPRFSFYEMLPNYEVVIPEEEYTDKGTSKSQTTVPKVEAPGRYVIQAGSFSAYEDADRRKAGLALLGVESRIEKVALDSGKTVYRVRSEPIEDLDELNTTLKKLRKEGIDTMVMRRKG